MENGLSFDQQLTAKEATAAAIRKRVEDQRAAEEAARVEEEYRRSWTVADPSYKLSSLVPDPNNPVRAMTRNELEGHATDLVNTNKIPGFGTDGKALTDKLLKTDKRTITQGVDKMVLPAGSAISAKAGTAAMKQQDFWVVPQGPVPDDYSKFDPQALRELLFSDPAMGFVVMRVAKDIHEAVKDTEPFDPADDYYPKRAMQWLRFQAMQRHYGFGNIAHAYHQEAVQKEPDKNIPDKLPVGMPGFPSLQTDMYIPGVPTLIGAGNAAVASGYDAAIGDRMFDFGQSLLGQFDEKKLGDLLSDAEKAKTPQRPRGFFGEDERRSRLPGTPALAPQFNEINNIIASKHTPDQLAAMTPEQKYQAGYQAAQEYLRRQSMNDLKGAFELTKLKNEGVSGWLTPEARAEGNSLSKLTQQTAASAVPTAAPMLASLVGSLAAGPVGGRAASALTTYKLSTDSQFVELLSKWAGENGIDINADPVVVMTMMQEMANKDPEGFSAKLKELVSSARVAGVLEAGTAAVLDVGLDKLVKIPGSKEGPIWDALKSMGQAGSSKVIAPRLAKFVEDTGKEAIEEYLTEVIVGLGKGINQDLRDGVDFREATKKNLREIAASFQDEDPNATDEEKEARKQMSGQRNDAAAIGAYMSIITRMLTGKGNPDTALIRQARSRAATALAAQRQTTQEKVEAMLKDGEERTFAQLVDKVNEMMVMEGNGTLDDDTQRRLAGPGELPLNGLIGGEDVRTPGQKAIANPTPIVQTAAPVNHGTVFARAMAETRRAIDQDMADATRERSLEIESIVAHRELLDATSHYHNMVEEYQKSSSVVDPDIPEIRKAREAMDEAQKKYKAIEAERGKK